MLPSSLLNYQPNAQSWRCWHLFHPEEDIDRNEMQYNAFLTADIGSHNEINTSVTLCGKHLDQLVEIKEKIYQMFGVKKNEYKVEIYCATKTTPIRIFELKNNELSIKENMKYHSYIIDEDRLLAVFLKNVEIKNEINEFNFYRIYINYDNSDYSFLIIGFFRDWLKISDVPHDIVDGIASFMKDSERFSFIGNCLLDQNEKVCDLKPKIKQIFRRKWRRMPEYFRLRAINDSNTMGFAYFDDCDLGEKEGKYKTQCFKHILLQKIYSNEFLDANKILLKFALYHEQTDNAVQRMIELSFSKHETIANVIQKLLLIFGVSNIAAFAKGKNYHLKPEYVMYLKCYVERSLVTATMTKQTIKDLRWNSSDVLFILENA